MHGMQIFCMADSQDGLRLPVNARNNVAQDNLYIEKKIASSAVFQVVAIMHCSHLMPHGTHQGMVLLFIVECCIRLSQCMGHSV